MRQGNILCVVFTLLCSGANAQYVVKIDALPADVVTQFSPLQAFGAGVDGVPGRTVPEIYTAANVQKMLAAGLGPVTYRLYTELSVQDWHWNPAGSFSETATQGYWTSAATSGPEIVNTYGYRLPRRGDTHDQGNDDDYSRLDDGNQATFWKSNPYLSAAFTGESDASHAQWVVIDLGSARAVNAINISWAAPYAVQFTVQYWTGDDAIGDPAQTSAAWVTFPAGTVTAGSGGTQLVKLGTAPKPHRFYRLLMTQSSGTCTAAGSADARNCVGYAIAELGLGTVSNGTFTDFIAHKPNNNQTATYVSSVDPWHQAQNDRLNVNGPDNQEQPGFDIVFGSGLTRGLPATIPIPMLYSTPENAAAEIRYLEAKGYAIARVEMGEEPDGQYIAPEDYGALYVQFASALHAVDPNLQLGGPVFESPSSSRTKVYDTVVWADSNGETSFTKRFVAYLAAHGALGSLNFFSFEHYPVDDCGGTSNTQLDLMSEPSLVAQSIANYRNDNLPTGTPVFITETNYSDNEGPVAQHVAGAVWYADLIGSALTNGAAGVFLYQYEPWALSPGSCGWGTFGLLQGNANFVAGAPLAQFFAARILSQDWAQPVDQPHALYRAAVTGPDGSVTAYPVLRPDGNWAVLLVNRDLTNAHSVQVNFNGANGVAGFSGTVSETVFGPAQYGWIAAQSKSMPSPDGPELSQTVQVQPGQTYTLPAGSVTVVMGAVSDE